jgi:tetratricopeptide (TPR) repeat protein
VRAGNTARAREMLARSGGTARGEAMGWLALYDGDLRVARRLLQRPEEPTPELVTARALLSRTGADTARHAGRGFLALAQGDTLGAIAAFSEAARELPDAASLLLATAARLHAARRDDERAMALWKTIARSHADTPEAPEAELEWARALRRAGEQAAAVERLEHLILTYPQSALVPQARRELELARALVPPTS